MIIGLSVLGIAGSMAAITRFHLAGADLRQFDEPSEPSFTPDKDSPGNLLVRDYLQENFINPAKAEGTSAEKLQAKRALFEQAGHRRAFEACEFEEDVAILPGQRSVVGEWTRVAGADPNRRLLYIHGGANTVGSAVSHRAITWNLARRTGLSVFAPNYRLMPENKRLDGVADVRTAWRWLAQNGPDGSTPAKKMALAGDSAGGNLALSLSNWLRDEKERQPEAVVAFSPATDATGSSPSFRKNYETDMMLKPLVGHLLKLPRPILLWLMWSANRVSPANPVVSPIFADLSGLPPTLLQVSAAEMLYDDARRFAVKARQSGSSVTLQSWDHMCHVWQIFDEMLPEAHHALDEAAAFLKQNSV